MADKMLKMQKLPKRGSAVASSGSHGKMAWMPGNSVRDQLGTIAAEYERIEADNHTLLSENKRLQQAVNKVRPAPTAFHSNDVDMMKGPNGYSTAPCDPFAECEVMEEYPTLTTSQVILQPQEHEHSEMPQVEKFDPVSLVNEVSGLSSTSYASGLEKGVSFAVENEGQQSEAVGMFRCVDSCASATLKDINDSMNRGSQEMTRLESQISFANEISPEYETERTDPSFDKTERTDEGRSAYGTEQTGVRSEHSEQYRDDDGLLASFDLGKSELKSGNLFPYWFDPGPSLRTSTPRQNSSAISFCKVRTASEDGPQDCGVLMPVGRLRLSWDLCAFICLLFELWATPFDLVFLDSVEDLAVLDYLSYTTVGFFSLDILLNFNTGYIENDRTILKRGKIIKSYLRFWFWVDLVATVPWDLILAMLGGGVFSFARMGKASKIMKTFRYLKMIRAMRLVRTMQQAGNVQNHFQILTPLRRLLKPLQIFTFLCLFAHLHGCIWAALQPAWVESLTISEAWRKYYHSFWWAFVYVLGNSMAEISNDESGMNTALVETLGMIIALERLALGVVAVREIMFYSLRFIEEAKKAQVKEKVLTYLRTHKVSFRTQLQVLFTFKDFAQAHARRRPWKELLANDLPREIRRTICDELWSQHLMSLGLIAKISEWQTDFVFELAQLVHEEVLATRTILFVEGEAAKSGYCIMSGELMVVNERNIPGLFLPNFVKGMWVGENALVSTVLRCSATLATCTITSLMKVRGEQFLQLISKLGLMEAFQQFCSENLWRGFCGRCGQIGNHFSDACGVAQRRRFSMDNITAAQQEAPKHVRYFSVNSLFSRHSSDKSGKSDKSARSDATSNGQCNGIGRDLSRYLREHRLGWLIPTLQDMNVNSLEELEQLTPEQYNFLKTKDLSDAEMQALSKEATSTFILKNARRTARTLFHQVNRLHHLIFLSHYKLEAGTEAALMRTELEQAILEDSGSLGHVFDEPVFLDSENLNSLEDLTRRVRNTHNLVLLLTKDVLTRPWVLIEILTAKRYGVRVLLVNISKPGSLFAFPDDAFFQELRDGNILDDDAVNVLRSGNHNLEELEEALREVFMQIAVPYSPHKAKNIRLAEITAVLKQCRLKSEGQGRSHSKMKRPTQSASLQLDSFAVADTYDHEGRLSNNTNATYHGRVSNESLDAR